ncbi:hypothetical protein R83H12_02683 [Fibrobacteria bacterium R8-3-H12]
MRIIAFLRHFQICINRLNFPANACVFHIFYIFYFKIIFANGYNIVVFQINNFVCVPNYCRNVACQKTFIFSNSNYKRAASACPNQNVWFIFAYNGKPKGTFHVLQCLQNRLAQIAFVKLGYPMHNNLGICIRNKFNTFGLQFFFEDCIVFNNAVVHKGYFPICGKLRMSVYFAGFAVRCPAGVANSQETF